MDEIFELLNLCYTRLQGLQITATRDNMETLLQTLYDLRHINEKLEKLKEGQKDGTEDGRTENNPA